MDKITRKQGDTFGFQITLRDAQGVLLDLNAIDIQSQVRKKNTELVQDLLISKIGTGVFKIYTTDTKAYPVGQLEIDVRGVEGVESFSTETIILDMQKAVTVWK